MFPNTLENEASKDIVTYLYHFSFLRKICWNILS